MFILFVTQASHKLYLQFQQISKSKVSIQTRNKLEAKQIKKPNNSYAKSTEKKV